MGAAARVGGRLRQRAASIALSWHGMSTAAATTSTTPGARRVSARAHRADLHAAGPRAWASPRPLPPRRATAPLTRASSSDATAAGETIAGSTVSEHARGYGTVVTSQANFLRVVVTRESMSQAEVDERALQLTQAMDRASQAGKTDDVAKLQERLGDEGPYELLCVVRALLKKIKQRVLVGDAVDVLGIDWVDQRAMVETVHARRSELVDPPVANVDHALLVFALERPPLEAKQLTRFLVSMEATGVPFTLVLNKADLCSEEQKADWAARLEQWGYVPRFVSVATGEGLDELERELATGMRTSRLDDEEDEVEVEGEGEEEEDGFDPSSSGLDPGPRSVTVLAGPSGVGKSSLINRLRAGSKLAEALAAAGELDEDGEDGEEGGECGGADEEGEDDSSSEDYSGADEETYEDAVKRFITDVDISGGGGGARGSISLDGLELQSVKAVSSKLGRGRHTTRHVTLLSLRSGGLLADTPGFGYPSLTTLTTATLPECFPEIVRAKNQLGACKFSDCTHRDEPGCVVDELMPWEEDRYDFYADMFDEVEQIERVERERGKRISEQRTKYKSGKGGGQGNGGGGGGRGRGGGRGARRAEAPGTNARMEAKLDTKSHRRQSRRSKKMETEAIERRDLSEWDDDEG